MSSGKQVLKMIMISVDLTGAHQDWPFTQVHCACNIDV
jgi:hypothetical protein